MTFIESDAEYWMHRRNEAIAERDEAVRLLREAREWLGNGLTVAKIDAYLAKAKT